LSEEAGIRDIGEEGTLVGIESLVRAEGGDASVLACGVDCAVLSRFSMLHGRAESETYLVVYVHRPDNLFAMGTSEGDALVKAETRASLNLDKIHARAAVAW
jgi:hypothetical protein